MKGTAAVLIGASLLAACPALAQTGQVGQGVRGLSGEKSGGGQPYPGGPDAPPADGATTFGKPPGATENHQAEALKHAQAAAQRGQRGDAAEAVEHAAIAKTHVQAVSRERPDDVRLNAALRYLDDAIRQGREGHAQAAGKGAADAVGELSASP